jgi:N-sulfoglucosamine sulfohydrolase
MFNKVLHLWRCLFGINRLVGGMVTISLAGCASEKSDRPNILICIADDASYEHLGTACDWIKTPAFNQVAEEGILFSNVYTPNAKSAPSRSSLLTGRNPWQLKAAANQYCYFPAEFRTFPEVLLEHGYQVGFTGKGWGPGEPGEIDGKPRELTGKAWNKKRTEPPTKFISNVDYASNFGEFLQGKPLGKPFCFWYGGFEPHRKYEYQSSLRGGKSPRDIDKVPAFLPDNEEVRIDLLDYGYEIEYFDQHLQKILDLLRQYGEYDNTLVIVTSDNGMPFPRAKSDEYEYSNHMPMAVMWKKGMKKPGRVNNEYVSFIDLAPTILDIAGVDWKESGMQPGPGRSIMPLLKNKKLKEPFNDFILIGKERHDVGRPADSGYPIRGIIHDGYLYLINYRPDLWPAGNPETGYPTVAGSPSKTAVLKAKNDTLLRHFWEWSFGKRPEEELYNVIADPFCLKNLVQDSIYDERKKSLRKKLKNELRAQDDPRMFGQGDVFQKYTFSDPRWRNAYERIIKLKEDLILPWINPSDVDSLIIEIKQ